MKIRPKFSEFFKKKMSKTLLSESCNDILEDEKVLKTIFIKGTLYIEACIYDKKNNLAQFKVSLLSQEDHKEILTFADMPIEMNGSKLIVDDLIFIHKIDITAP